jgi:hypothetical protein
MNSPPIYYCVLCRRAKYHRPFVCQACYRQVALYRRNRIGLASPWSKQRRTTLPPPSTKH